MQIHPYAQIFPAMSDSDFEGLMEDIRLHGQREPIVLFGDAILDGVHRYRACEKLSIVPKQTNYTGPDPLAFVFSANLHRRHLDASQRAMIAATIATLQDGQRQVGPWAYLPTQAQAAKLLNVSERSVKRARAVLDSGDPELIASVQSGKIAVRQAADDVIAKGGIERTRKQKRDSSQRSRARRAEAKAKDEAAKARRIEQVRSASKRYRAKIVEAKEQSVLQNRDTLPEWKQPLYRGDEDDQKIWSIFIIEKHRAESMMTGRVIPVGTVMGDLIKLSNLYTQVVNKTRLIGVFSKYACLRRNGQDVGDDSGEPWAERKQ